MVNSVQRFNEFRRHLHIQGLRTLEDIRDKAKLTNNQKIGLKYFEGFDERMLRDEVAKIENVVSDEIIDDFVTLFTYYAWWIAITNRW